jgi:cysteine synthase B
MPVSASVLDLIGNTPMVDVSRLSPAPGVRIVAKLEGQNPGGSIKDRIAKAMVEAAETDGTLKPGQTLLEPSSGNTGIGLAMVCLLKGYPLRIVLPENVSPERRQLLEIFGAEIIQSPGSEGSNGAVRMAQRLVAEDPSVAFLYQYGNPANPRAHYETTGPEILRDCPEITHLVAGLGTAGTLMGTGRYFREHKPTVEMWAVEPPAGELVEGLRNLDDGFVPPVYDPSLIDRRIIVRPRESIEWTRRLTTEAGIFSGISAGAAMAGAAKAAAQLAAEGKEGVIVTVLADGGWKYLSTGAWTDPLDEVVERAKKIIYF